MTKVIGVRFRTGMRIYYFDPLDFDVQAGDGVIVETAKGQEYGEVVQGITEVEETAIVAPLKPIIRVASDQDQSMRKENSGREKEAFAICQKKIEQHGLDMKLVDVEYSFNGSKVVFYFTADERVDFRELVKDLAGQFRTRIELRQIGVRDEAKMLGGLGPCGRAICCKSFLSDFRPVSIKMAKEQNLSLSPTKISGLCGRLMCCLQYEQNAYDDMKKKMPKVNREVMTPDGLGTAIENNAITEKTKVRITLSDGSFDVREYHYSELGEPGENPVQVTETQPARTEKPEEKAEKEKEKPEGDKSRSRRRKRPERKKEEKDPQEVGDRFQTSRKDNGQKKEENSKEIKEIKKSPKHRRRRRSSQKQEGRPESASESKTEE